MKYEGFNTWLYFWQGGRMIKPMILYAIDVIYEDKETEIPVTFLEHGSLFSEMLLLGYITITQINDNFIAVLTEQGLTLARGNLDNLIPLQH